MKHKIKQIILRLLSLNNTPYEIALGSAIGVFIGILPLYGLHTVLVILAAVLIRPANKIAILVGTNISLPPTVPFITWAGYEIGRIILKNGFSPLQWSDFKNITLQKVIKHYPPLLLGSLILGIICAAIAYLLVFSLMSHLRKKG